ncbi:MAG: bifunctional diaminohydroxyphosphoribosylaminopyrimidine deaminase/5-amino-6-(5-phosphoribosylamino)uracil reductase RibD [Acidobacteriaceae bacterium]
MGSSRPPTGDFRNNIDEGFMGQALRLARATAGLASPNPQVGCVVVRDGVVVGEGAHVYEGRSHAEIVALRRAGRLARGAAVYVTLEPCSHHGRTGPCADALIAAGVRWVVASTVDPNPTVAGRGFARLRDAGVEVAVGVLEGEARALNDGFARWIRTGRPLVTLKAALSADGMLAPPRSARTERQAFWITGAEARAEVQRMRHGVDAVLTGIDTVLADDPLLTDRTGLVRRRPLLRVVLDSRLRIPLDSQLVRTAEGDVLVFCDALAEAQRVAALEAAGVEVARVAGSAGRLDLGAVLDALGKRQSLSVLLECGAELNGAFLREGLVDRVALFYAETKLGEGAMPFAAGVGSPLQLEQEMKAVTRRAFGPDVCVGGYLRDVWDGVEG